MNVRRLVFRVCGYLTLVQSDFGTEYRTYQFVSSEALYASLTRGATRRFGRIEADMNRDFHQWYEVSSYPVWFLPGIFDGPPKREEHVFNVVDELTPSTSEYSSVSAKGWKVSKRTSLPTYGLIESIKPGQVFSTVGLGEKRLLEGFEKGQTFLLGKKRVMIQLMHLSCVGELRPGGGEDECWPIPVRPDSLRRFTSYTVHYATSEFLIASGKGEGLLSASVLLEDQEGAIAIPEWWLEGLTWLRQKTG